MDPLEIFISILVGIGTGCLSGWITGVMVTKYYRKKDNEKEEMRRKEDAMSSLVDYIESIGYEFEEVEKDPQRGYSGLCILLKERSKRIADMYLVCPEEMKDIMHELASMERLCNADRVDISTLKLHIQEMSLKMISIIGRRMCQDECG